MDTLQIDLDGPVHYIERPGTDPDAPTVVLVHGLGASMLSWHAVLPLLPERNRVLALDLVGFGHSEPGTRRSTVAANTELLARFVRHHTDQPVVLVGNSMGGMLAVLTATAHPDVVDRLVLLNPSVPTFHPGAVRAIDPRLALDFLLYLTPGAGEALLRWRRGRTTPREQVQRLLRLICADPSRVPADTVDVLVAGAAHRRGYGWSDRAFLDAQRSIIRQLSVGKAAYTAAIDGLAVPTLLLHGEADPLVPVGAARAAAARNPRIDLVTLPGVGHAPQLEAPDEVAHHLAEALRQASSSRR